VLPALPLDPAPRLAAVACRVLAPGHRRVLTVTRFLTVVKHSLDDRLDDFPLVKAGNFGTLAYQR
jgi:hypothetical protein